MRRAVENIALPFRALDGRLERFRVARNARFRDGCAGIPPRVRGGERGGVAGEGAAFKPDGDGTLANRANARFPRIRFVVKKTGKMPQLPLHRGEFH
jgi:hypothetical protein